MKLTNQEVRDLLGISKQTYTEMLSWTCPSKLQSMVGQLVSIVGSKNLRKWIRQTRPGMGTTKPINLLRAGNTKPLEAWIYVKLDGEYS